jgi:hypothetical protein
LDAHGIRVTGKWSFLQQALESHPGSSLLGHYLGNLVQLLTLLTGTVGPVLVLLAFAGALARPRRSLICLSPLLVLPIFDFRMAERYLLPYLPFILVSAAGGAVWISARLSPRWGRRAVQGLIVASVIVTLTGAGYTRRELLRGNFEYYPAMRDAGIWLRERVDRDTIIAGRKPYVSFWAWCEFRRIPESGTLDQLVAWAEEEGCEFLVVHVGVALGMAPALVPLLEGVPPPLSERIQLVRIFSIAGQPNETTYVYRILATGPRGRGPAPEAQAGE